MCNLKGALSKYDDNFAIKEKFNCKNQDVKMFKILNAERLPILQIVQLIFICCEEFYLLSLSRVLEDFVTE